MQFSKVSVLYVLVIVQRYAAAEDQPKKRGIFDGNFGNDFTINTGSFEAYSHPGFTSPAAISKPIWKTIHAVSSAEIATAISAAKEASDHVMQAQHRVQIAKDAVINQQRIAQQKEAHASLAVQKAEAAVASARQEAKAAATAVVLAQQRLAQAKSEVAEHQRIAVEKEAHAAAVIHKSANQAAAEIQRTEDTAVKIAAIQKSQARAVLKHVTDAKDERVTAATAAVAASASSANNYGHQHPWVNVGKTFYIPQWH